MDALGLEIEGDAEDQKEEARRKRARGDSKSEAEHLAVISDEKLCAASKQKLIDWRNKTQKRRLARSVVGTSQYMAPEVIRGEHYDGRCDWWSIGVIMYECLFGKSRRRCPAVVLLTLSQRIHSIRNGIEKRHENQDSQTQRDPALSSCPRVAPDRLSRRSRSNAKTSG